MQSGQGRALEPDDDGSTAMRSAVEGYSQRLTVIPLNILVMLNEQLPEEYGFHGAYPARKVQDVGPADDGCGRNGPSARRFVDRDSYVVSSTVVLAGPEACVCQTAVGSFDSR